MLWIETKTPEDAKLLYDRMWGVEMREVEGVAQLRGRGESLSEDGEFWGDTIAKLKDDPKARLNMAIRHLPLPGAFHQAAVALRTIIRDKRKQKSDYSSELGQLYHLAAILSFAIPYAPHLKQPGYNVFARVPFAEFQTMSLTWQTLGCEKLDLLSKTDRRWMVGAWGAPTVHTTAHEKYLNVWKWYEDMLIAEDRSNR